MNPCCDLLPVVRCRAAGFGLLPAALCLLLVGCATTQTGRRQVYIPPANTGVTTQPTTTGPAIYTPQSVPAPALPPAPAFASNIMQSGANPAVLALYQAARQAQAAAQFDDAGNDLERALHLDPRNPFVWSALASLHLQMKQPQQAESEASKSNSLSRGNPYLLRDNWQTIAHARQASGDAQGALQARAMAQRYTQLPGGQ